MQFSSVYNYPPALYPLTSTHLSPPQPAQQITSFHGLSPVDAVASIASITHLVDERQRIQLELLRLHVQEQLKTSQLHSAQVAQLSNQMVSMHTSLRAVMHTQGVNDHKLPDAADADDGRMLLADVTILFSLTASNLLSGRSTATDRQRRKSTKYTAVASRVSCKP